MTSSSHTKQKQRKWRKNASKVKWKRRINRPSSVLLFIAQQLDVDFEINSAHTARDPRDLSLEPHFHLKPRKVNKHFFFHFSTICPMVRQLFLFFRCEKIKKNEQRKNFMLNNELMYSHWTFVREPFPILLNKQATRQFYLPALSWHWRVIKIENKYSIIIGSSASSSELIWIIANHGARL